MITIVAGGQTGGDLGGWKAAKLAGLSTRGVMPRVYLDERGPQPHYADLYGATEHASPEWKPRTIQNVRDSDATLIFRSCRAKSHRGCDLTQETCVKLKKPYIVIPVWSVPDAVIKTRDLAEKVAKYKFKVLNIAGTRSSSDPGEPGKPWTGIEGWCFCYCLDLFTLLREHP